MKLGELKELLDEIGPDDADITPVDVGNGDVLKLNGIGFDARLGHTLEVELED